MFLYLCTQVAWYNLLLPSSLHLAYPDDSLAVVVLSTPTMFEQAFLPFLEERGCHSLTDPIDQCIKYYVSSAVSQVRVVGEEEGTDRTGPEIQMKNHIDTQSNWNSTVRYFEQIWQWCKYCLKALQQQCRQLSS